MEEKKVWFEDKHGNKLCGVLHTPGGKGPFPAVVLTPGLSSCKDRPRYVAPAKSLCKEKIAALRIDPFGHGESYGDPKDVTLTSGVESISAAVLYIKSLSNTNKIGLMGSSFGGATSLYFSANNPTINAIVLKSSSSDLLEQLEDYLTEENMERWKDSGELTIGKHNHTMRYIFYQDLIENYKNPFEKIRAVTAPTLIIHGDKDESIPLRQAKKIYAALGGPKRMEILKGVGHIVKDSKSLSLINKWAVDWFKKYLK